MTDWKKRKFDGEEFQSHPDKKHGTHKKKKEANDHADRLREKGFHARVVPEGSRYRVWQGKRCGKK